MSLTSEEKVEKSIDALLGLLLAVVFIMCQAHCIIAVYEWFIVPLFTTALIAPSISVTVAIGISFAFDVFAERGIDPNYKTDNKGKLLGLVRLGIVFLITWIFHCVA